MVCKASVLNWLGGPYIDIYINCSGMQGIYDQLTRGGSSSSYIYIHMQCSGMQGIYDELTRGFICLLSICSTLDLALGVVVCKASVLNWPGGVHLLPIYIKCNGMQGLCAQLTRGVHLPSIYIWLIYIYICMVLDVALSVVVCKPSVLNCLGGHLPPVYIYAV